MMLRACCTSHVAPSAPRAASGHKSIENNATSRRIVLNLWDICALAFSRVRRTGVIRESKGRGRTGIVMALGVSSRVA